MKTNDSNDFINFSCDVTYLQCEEFKCVSTVWESDRELDQSQVYNSLNHISYHISSPRAS